MAEEPPRRGADASLEGTAATANIDFHDAYDAARRATEVTAPILVVLGDSLLVFRNDARAEACVIPPFVHVIKAVAHAPLIVFTELFQSGSGPFSVATEARLARARERLTAVQRALADSPDSPNDESVLATLHAVLDLALSFVNTVLGAHTASLAERDAFAERLGPPLLACTVAATRLQLEALDRAVRTVLATMDEQERSAFEVVVAGAHQARSKSLPLQYFEKLLDEPPGAEDRITYAESVLDEGAARALVGTKRVDRAIATAFFGDAKRLQRDVLADAAKDCLAALDPASLAPR